MVNEEIKKLVTKIQLLKESTKNEIIKIKLQEVLKSMTIVTKKERVTDAHLVDIMQYYELIKELKGL